MTLFGVLGLTLVYVAVIIYGRKLNVIIVAILVTIPLERNYKSLRKIFKRIDGAEVYRAS